MVRISFDIIITSARMQGPPSWISGTFHVRMSWKKEKKRSASHSDAWCLLSLSQRTHDFLMGIFYPNIQI